MLAVAAVGVVVPLLPTTPFLIVASGCFMRSDPRCGALMLRIPLFGRMLKDWHERRVVRPRVKLTAVGTMALFGVTTIAVGSFTWILNLLLLSAMAVGATVVVRLPSSAP